MMRTASRSVVSMNMIASGGTSPVASRRIEAIEALVANASLPPRRTTAFPDLRQSAAASAVTFGRDS